MCGATLGDHLADVNWAPGKRAHGTAFVQPDSNGTSCDKDMGSKEWKTYLTLSNYLSNYLSIYLSKKTSYIFVNFYGVWDWKTPNVSVLHFLLNNCYCPRSFFGNLFVIFGSMFGHFAIVQSFSGDILVVFWVKVTFWQSFGHLPMYLTV